jgi:hypothetical protein
MEILLIAILYLAYTLPAFDSASGPNVKRR